MASSKQGVAPMSNATRGIDLFFLDVWSLLCFCCCCFGGSSGCLSSKTTLVPMPALDQTERISQWVEEVDIDRLRRADWGRLRVILRKAAARSACKTVCWAECDHDSYNTTLDPNDLLLIQFYYFFIIIQEYHFMLGRSSRCNRKNDSLLFFPKKSKSLFMMTNLAELSENLV